MHHIEVNAFLPSLVACTEYFCVHQYTRWPKKVSHYVKLGHIEYLIQSYYILVLNL